eukprot:1745257-Amphidinium_carterae.1
MMCPPAYVLLSSSIQLCSWLLRSATVVDVKEWGWSGVLHQHAVRGQEATLCPKLVRPAAPTLLTSSRTVTCCSMVMVPSRPSPVALVPLTLTAHSTAMPVVYRPVGPQLPDSEPYLGKVESGSDAGPEEQTSPDGTPPSGDMPCKTTAIAQLQDLRACACSASCETHAHMTRSCCRPHNSRCAFGILQGL